MKTASPKTGNFSAFSTQQRGGELGGSLSRVTASAKLESSLAARGSDPTLDQIIRAEIYTAKHHGARANIFDPSNLQGSCHACHNHKTSLED